MTWGPVSFHRKLFSESMARKLGEPLPFQLGPGMPLPVMQKNEENASGLRAEPMIWGWTLPGSSRPVINARAESFSEGKPLFREAWQHGRCLVPCYGYFEWEQGGNRLPWLTKNASDAEPLWLAALWKMDHRDGPRVVVVTAPSGETTGKLHHRKPVILARESRGDWLEGLLPPGQGMLEERDLVCWPVNSAVGNIRFQEDGLWEKKEPPEQMEFIIS